MKKVKKWRRLLAVMLAMAMITQNAWTIMAEVTQEDLDRRAGITEEIPEETPQTEQPEPQQEDPVIPVEEETGTGGDGLFSSGDGQVTPGEGEGDGTTDETPVVSTNVSASATQEIYQEEIDGVIHNYVRMQAQVTNNDTVNAATGVGIKVLLPEQMYYISAGYETAGLSAFNNPGELSSYLDVNPGFHLNEVSQDVINAHANGQVMMWLD